MKKKDCLITIMFFIIIALLGSLGLSFRSIRKMSNRACYWMGRSNAAEQLIFKTMDLNSYLYTNEVMKTNQWYNWYNKYYDRYYNKSR